MSLAEYQSSFYTGASASQWQSYISVFLRTGFAFTSHSYWRVRMRHFPVLFSALFLPVGSCTATIPCSNESCCNAATGFCGFNFAELDVSRTATPPVPPPAVQINRALLKDESATTREIFSVSQPFAVNFAFALISGDSYNVIEMSPGDASLWARTTALKKNNVGLKVFLSIGGWSFNDPPTSNVFSDLVGSAANTNAFITSALQTLQAYAFDGIDVDWEYPAAYDRGGNPADKENYVTFMAKVKAAFAPRGYGLTFTAPSSYWYLQHFDLPGLLKSADWVNVMTYDLHGTWDGIDPYIGAIVLAHTNLTEIEQTLQLYTNVGVNPNQIVLGIGFYGRSFQLADPGCTSPGCPFVGGAAPGPCSANSGTLMFSEIETIIAQDGVQSVFDEVAAVKYIIWNNDQWVSYDDAQTFEMKLNFANTRCLGVICAWVGSTPLCLESSCPIGQVAIFSDIQGDSTLPCILGKRLYCCNPPMNEEFLPVPEQWVLPELNPTPGGTEVLQPTSFTVDFDDNTGTSDTNSAGAGSSGESDDGEENDSPFGEVFISSPNPGSVSSLDLASDWVIQNCDPKSDQPQTVLAYCSKSMDSDDAGCGHVFIGQAEHTIVRLPASCGLGPFARVIALAPHEDQSILPAHLRRDLPDNELIYSLEFDYNFAAIPDENGPILMRADVTDMPGYWDEMINSPPDDGTTSTKRSNYKRNFHQPEELERRWFGSFDRWLQKLNTITNTNSISRNFHWSDKSCPNFSSSLDISVSGLAQANSRFGYYLEATIIPPAVQQCYVFLNAGASAQATFTIQGLAKVQFGTERAEIISFGFPGRAGLLTLGPSLHLYGELTGQLSLSGMYKASVGYTFPSLDLAFGKQDSNADEEQPGGPVTPTGSNNGFDYSMGYNVDLQASVEAHLIPSLQIGVSVLNGAVLDAQVFVEADLYAGVSVTGSVSSAVAPQICVNPYYGVNLNAGLTGSVLFWRDNAITYPFYTNQFPFGGKCFTSQPEGSGSERRDQILSDRSDSNSTLPISHRSPYPAYSAYETATNDWATPPSLPVDVANSTLAKRDGVPFLPGNLFCPATGTDITSDATGGDCVCYSDADIDPISNEFIVAKREEVSERDLNSTFGDNPFKILRSVKLQQCAINIQMPGYDSTPIVAYYDLDNPGILDPTFESYVPSVPVNLGTKTGANGLPYLSIPSGNGNKNIYASNLQFPISHNNNERHWQESLSALFVDSLQNSQSLWTNGAGTNTWCSWVTANLVNRPAYRPAAWGTDSVFVRLAKCYPGNAARSPMVVLEQEANVMKNTAIAFKAKSLLGLGTEPLRTNDKFNSYCPQKQIAVLRAAAGITSFLNDNVVSQIFINQNTCIRTVWTDWQTAYRASNVDAPFRNNVDVVALYNTWIIQVMNNVAPFIRDQIKALILLYNAGQPGAATVDLSFAVLLDQTTFTRGKNGSPQQISTPASVYTQGAQVSADDLTNQVLNRVQDITWVNFLQP
ncbi:glycosyl hydrolases family 18-domain-containing protein [Mycena amicta]|nr:glycosyl hydrolases family 18-domain-containing protein [Mycena amicta]